MADKCGGGIGRASAGAVRLSVGAGGCRISGARTDRVADRDFPVHGPLGDAGLQRGIGVVGCVVGYGCFLALLPQAVFPWAATLVPAA